MEPLKQHKGRTLILNRVNVDTDQIIPKQFLKRVERSGFGEFLFYNWRFNEEGQPDPSFELNQPHSQGASILVAGENFGCGSSREHAAWALLDYGIRVVIAPSFADIFFNNCFKNGILPICLPADEIQTLMDKGSLGVYELTVDLEEQEVFDDERSFVCEFQVDSFRRHMLLEGLDDIDLTLQYSTAISEYEAKRKFAV